MKKGTLSNLLVFFVLIPNSAVCCAIIWQVITSRNTLEIVVVSICTVVLVLLMPTYLRGFLSTKHFEKVYLYLASFLAIGGWIGGTVLHNTLFLRIGLGFVLPAIVLNISLVRWIMQKRLHESTSLN